MSPRPHRTNNTPTHQTKHPLPLGTVVDARQSRHSPSWDEALITSFRVKRGYTLYSLTWTDDSDGSWSRNIPQSRVKAKTSPDTITPPSPQPADHPSQPILGTDTPHPLPPNTHVTAKQARFSRVWDNATVLSHRTSRGQIQYNIRWDVDGSLSDHVPLSFVRTRAPPLLLSQPTPPPTPPPHTHHPQTPPLAHTPPPFPRGQPTRLHATLYPPPPQLVAEQDTAHPLPPDTRVFAKQARSSQLWEEAHVLSSRTTRGRVHYGLLWVSDGSFSESIPQSLTRVPDSCSRPTQRPPSPPPSPVDHDNPGPQPSPTSTPPSRPKPNRTAWATWKPPAYTPPCLTRTPPLIMGIIPVGGPILVLYGNWADAILSGSKTIEVRAQNTTKRGTIFLMKSGTAVVCGSVDITHITDISTDWEWRRLAPWHKIGKASDPTQIAPYPDTIQRAWHLSNPKRFQSPIKTVLKRGPVTFQTFLPPPPPVSLSHSPKLLVGPQASPASTPHTQTYRPGPPPRSPNTRLPPATRARATCAAMIQHQNYVTRASMRSSHTDTFMQLAQSLIDYLSSHKGSAHSSYPFQQEEVAYAVSRIAKRTTVMTQAKRQDPNAPVTKFVWHAMLVAKYTGLSDTHGSAIAHGVYVPRGSGPVHHTLLNSDTSMELGWLAAVHGQPSHHHHHGTSYMWHRLNLESYDPNARIPALRRSEQEVTSAIALAGKNPPLQTPSTPPTRVQLSPLCSPRATWSPSRLTRINVT